MSTQEQINKQEILDNRAKLAEKIGNVRAGGKNIARRTHKAVGKT